MKPEMSEWQALLALSPQSFLFLVTLCDDASIISTFIISFEYYYFCPGRNGLPEGAIPLCDFLPVFQCFGQL